VRRLVAIAVVAVAVMVATVVLSPQVTVLDETSTPTKFSISGANKAYAQPNVGGPTYCGPWQQAWFVSPSQWWYYWWWRWCYNPSLPPSATQGGWYIDWAGWHWHGPAPPGLRPGWHHNGPPPP
jgi:hypothetical protein